MVTGRILDDILAGNTAGSDFGFASSGALLVWHLASKPNRRPCS